MYVLVAILLVLLNSLWLWMTVIGLPGNWMMILGAATCALVMKSPVMFDPRTIALMAFLAVLGELGEFLSSIYGARRAGGSRWGAVGALTGSLLGGILGTCLIAIPVIGTIAGACIGAFAAACLFEKVSGRTLEESVHSGTGAALGRLLGLAGKTGIGIAIWIICAAAALWP